MRDQECIAFLQWALPRLHLRWPGFRKVRHRVCRRIAARMRELRLPGVAAYRAHLEHHPAEWATLDGLCRITVSVFYRDRAVFDFLTDSVLPALWRKAAARGEGTLRTWSIGCASGEEPYSVVLAGQLGAHPPAAGIEMAILATDVDAAVLRRAAVACYPYSSIKLLPPEWIARAFDAIDRHYCLREPYRKRVRFERHDVRLTLPEQHFDLILCRNLVFTYFDADLQRETLARLLGRLRPGGAFVIGRREVLPEGSDLVPWRADLGIYRLHIGAARP